MIWYCLIDLFSVKSKFDIEWICKWGFLSSNWIFYHLGPFLYVAAVQSLSHVQLFARPWTAACQASPVLHYLPEFAQTHVYWVSEAIQPSHPLSPSFPLAFNLSQHQVFFFSNESVLPIRWPKDWSFSIIPSSEYSGLISFRIDWFDLLAFQRTLKSILHHHSSKAPVPWHLAFLVVQLLHLGPLILCFLICCLGFLSMYSITKTEILVVAMLFKNSVKPWHAFLLCPMRTA